MLLLRTEMQARLARSHLTRVFERFKKRSKTRPRKNLGLKNGLRKAVFLCLFFLKQNVLAEMTVIETLHGFGGQEVDQREEPDYHEHSDVGTDKMECLRCSCEG